MGEVTIALPDECAGLVRDYAERDARQQLLWDCAMQAEDQLGRQLEGWGPSVQKPLELRRLADNARTLAYELAKGAPDGDPMTIDRRERNALYGEAMLDLPGVSDIRLSLEKRDCEGARVSARGFMADMRLLDEIGWEPNAGPREAFPIGLSRDEFVWMVSRYLGRVEDSLAEGDVNEDDEGRRGYDAEIRDIFKGILDRLTEGGV
jgi:hypothetical protein